MAKHTVFSRFLPLAVLAALILWLSLSPNPPTPPRALSWDKVQHALAYAFLTLLAGRYFSYLLRSPLRGWLAGASFAVLYGALIEIFQGVFTARRHADLMDLVANVTGVLSVLFVVALWHRLFGRVE